MYRSTFEEAQASRFARSGASGALVWRTQLFGPAPSPAVRDSLLTAGALDYVDPLPGEVRAPQAFLVEQEPGALIAPHFHYVDQFQVAVAGRGRLGAHELRPLSVHFSQRCTGYGPIDPGDEGFAYFTFRATADETGAQYLPGARGRMRPGRRRNVIAPHIAVSDDEALAGRKVSSATSVVPDAGDGLEVIYHRLAPHAPMQTPPSAAGISLLVAAGSVLQAGQSCGRWSCMFLAPGERAVLDAGARGAEVLLMCYPLAA
jgi:hypothetical protein